MALIEDTLDGKIDKVKIAINRIKNFAPIENGYMDTPYYVAYSGGKDSDVIRILCDLAGVKHELYHNLTTADAPETVHYVKSIEKINISYPDISMWKLIEKKGIPPSRMFRYCCSELKERGGKDRFVMTGVRWDESTKRRNRNSLEVLRSSRKNNIILNADNDENRKLFENCQLKGKKIINPIIDWSDSDVWEFLSFNGCNSNPLYQCGFNRVGCIGCPMVNRAKRIFELEYFPKYKQLFVHAFDRMLKQHEYPTAEWKSGMDVYRWWLTDKAAIRPIDGQVEMEV